MNANRTRHFFHSFPRPKSGEQEDATLERGLSILATMKDVGLVLAPEIVEWDLNAITGGREQLKLVQRRASFTELSESELAPHSKVFGPIALSFDIAALREAGATPVIYVPQGVADSTLSQIATFCVRGAYHTRYVLRQLQGLKETSDPQLTAAHFGQPVAPDYKLHLQNSDSSGNVVASYEVPALQVQQVLQHVGFNNIPFDHSAGILSVFMNMFYPADNTHTGDQLGYYRQREWRLIAGDVNFNGRPMGRALSSAEIATLEGIDPDFWNREPPVPRPPVSPVLSGRDQASPTPFDDFAPAQRRSMLSEYNTIMAITWLSTPQIGSQQAPSICAPSTVGVEVLNPFRAV